MNNKFLMVKNMKKFLILSLIGFIVLLTNFGAGDKKDSKIFPFDYKLYVLDNGLKVYIVPLNSQGLMSYYSVVRTGSRDEYEEGHSGFAHFFEHMMFRGTKRYPGGVYDSITIAMGADANAYTTDDYTCYHISSTKDNLEKIIDLESDRFQFLNYEEPAFKTESGAVYGEYRKGKTEPSFWLYEKMYYVAFDKHTYKHTTIGFEKDIAAMPSMYQYSINFLKRYYRPENTVICITGDVQPEKTMELIKKYYGNWPKGYVVPKIVPEPEQTAPREAQVQYPGKTLPMIALAYKSMQFSPADKQYFASILFGELAFGDVSDLQKKLYIQEQVVQSLNAEFSNNRDPNLNVIYSVIKDEKSINYVRTSILNEIEKFKTTPISQQKLDNLKKRYKYKYLMSLDTPDKVAGGLSKFLALTGDLESVNIAFRTIAEVTPNDILKAAQTQFAPEKRTIITLTGGK